MLNSALILAGGFGTRLQSVVSDLPKPMAPVNGKPFLDYMLSWLNASGIKHVVLCTGHLAEKIETHYGSKFRGLELEYSRETEPLGTGGAIKKTLTLIHEKEILVVNGDSLFHAPLETFYRRHVNAGRPVSLALRRVDDASRYGGITLDQQQRILAFQEKSDESKPGLINAGVYILEKEIYINNSPAQKNFSIEKDFFQAKCGSIAMSGFEFDSYFIDIGIPADYQKAQDDFKRFKD